MTTPSFSGLQLRRVGAPEGPRPIAPHPAGLRQLQRPRQLAVVGEEQQALGIQVQPPDGDHARHARRQVLEHGRAPLRVGVADQQAGRLVVAPHPRRLGRIDGLAVDGEDVAGRDLHGGRVQHLAVDGDAPRPDQPLHLAARGDAGPGQRLGDAIAGLALRGGLTAALSRGAFGGMSDHDALHMHRALTLAQAAAVAGEAPIGAVIVDPETNRVVAAGGQSPDRRLRPDRPRRDRRPARRRPRPRQLPADGPDALRHPRALPDVRRRHQPGPHRPPRLRRVATPRAAASCTAPGCSTTRNATGNRPSSMGSWRRRAPPS